MVSVKLSGGTLSGIIIGAIVVILLMVFGALCLCRRIRSRKQASRVPTVVQADEDDDEDSAPPKYEAVSDADLQNDTASKPFLTGPANSNELVEMRVPLEMLLPQNSTTACLVDRLLLSN